MEDAMLAKHILMVLYECFRLQRRDTRYDVLWEVVYIIRKLLIVVAAVCCPVDMRLYVVLLLLIAFLLHHIKEKPYSNSTMNWVEAVSIATLCVLCTFNIFWTYQNDIVEGRLTQLVILHVEYIILCFPIIFTVLFLITALLCFIFNKTCCKG